MYKILHFIKKIFLTIFHPNDFYFHRIQPKIRHRRFPSCDSSSVVYRPLKFNPTNVTLGKNVYIYKNARISCVFNYAGDKFSPNLVIGEFTTIQQNVHITCAKSIYIGKYCAITHNVTITDIDHTFEYPIPQLTPPSCNKLIATDVHIGDYCMIFPNSVILGGTKLGINCVIAANAVVRGDYPDGCLIGGIPAKILKRYNPNTDKWERTDEKGNYLIK